MGEHRPGQVLETVYKNFDALEEREPERARALRSRLRVIVAGGDGTVGWTLQVPTLVDKSFDTPRLHMCDQCSCERWTRSSSTDVCRRLSALFHAGNKTLRHRAAPARGHHTARHGQRHVANLRLGRRLRPGVGQ